MWEVNRIRNSKAAALLREELGDRVFKVTVDRVQTGAATAICDDLKPHVVLVESLFGPLYIGTELQVRVLVKRKKRFMRARGNSWRFEGVVPDPSPSDAG